MYKLIKQVRNYENFNTFKITLRGGAALYATASSLDYTKEQVLQSIVFNFSETIGTKLFPNVFEEILNNNPDLREFFDPDKKPYRFVLLGNFKLSQRTVQLAKTGLTPELIDKQITKEALEKILDKPITYLLQRFLEFEKLLAFTYIPTLNQFNTENYFYKYHNGDIFLTLLKAPLRLLGYLIFILSVYGMIITRYKVNESLFLLLIIMLYGLL